MINRRNLLATGAAAAAIPTIARAAAIDARTRTGTIKDVEHVVILMQENRGFDHYFGSMNGVRGFADPFPVPLAGGRTVWAQQNAQRTLTPFPLDTAAAWDLMRMQGTPHNWIDSQAAWDHGRMGKWPAAKSDRAMAHYREGDLPFQFALADAFTICDAYHCSIQTGTNTNRLFLWTGANDPLAKAGGPAIDNSHDTLPPKGPKDPYLWTTYAERLQAAGVSWRVYQDMADNFSDNPLVGFKPFRDALAGAPGSNRALAERGLTTRALDGLRADVMAKTLPQVSYVISPAADSEHPGPSSPAQGADYTARVIEALTADPEVWSRTALLIMFDENDGFFDHVPPPAPPSKIGDKLAGASTVDTTGEYHLHKTAPDSKSERDDLMGRPYGLGARVPMYVVSPWSRGGWVNSQVFDHTSVIRFLETRFGVIEPNISAWRRSVCGDLTSAFDFRTPNAARAAKPLPETKARAERAHAIPKQPNPAPPAELKAPVQASGVRPSRALPYALGVEPAVSAAGVSLRFVNRGQAGAVIHVYDRLHLDEVPRRYTVGAGQSLEGFWTGSDHDLWILGPNGFHRHIAGAARSDAPVVSFSADPGKSQVRLAMLNPGSKPRALTVTPMSHDRSLSAKTIVVKPGARVDGAWAHTATYGWYDLLVRVEGDAAYQRRFAGRIETGRDSVTDPAMAGPASLAWKT